jgi:hypothetical protein
MPMLKRTMIAAALLACAGLAAPAQAAGPNAFEFVALGDMPYTLPADYAKFDRVIAAVNAMKPAFTLHVGDVKSGSSVCSDEVLQKAFDQIQTFEQPLVYTPGDNEWVDCHRARAGGFDPLERLAKVRKLFFPVVGQSLGKTTMPVESQARVMADKFGMYVENNRFVKNGVYIASVHVPGSNNNFEPGKPETAMEYFGRDAANVAWIADTFAKAKAASAKAVVLFWQADVQDIRQKEDEMPRASAFVNTVNAVEAGAKDFPGRVLVIHGDEHIFQVGPFLNAKYKPIPRVLRLEVMGEKHIHAVRVTVDPDSPGVFGFTPILVPENGDM